MKELLKLMAGVVILVLIFSKGIFWIAHFIDFIPDPSKTGAACITTEKQQ